jgi:hypothetical protein
MVTAFTCLESSTVSIMRFLTYLWNVILLRTGLGVCINHRECQNPVPVYIHAPLDNKGRDQRVQTATPLTLRILYTSLLDTHLESLFSEG